MHVIQVEAFIKIKRRKSKEERKGERDSFLKITNYHALHEQVTRHDQLHLLT